MTKRMKILFTAALVICALCGSISAQPAGSPVAKHGKLSVKGNRIVNKDGQPVALRGMSFYWNNGWTQPSFYNSGVVNTLADDWKVDIVRVAIDPEETGNTNWGTVVAAAKARGIYVIIDFHAHSKNYSDRSKTFFEGVAGNTEYKNAPHVIYEIFNEPCPTTANQNGGGGCQGDSWLNDVKPYAETVVKAIRDKGDTSVIIIGTPDFSKRVDEASNNPVTAGGGKNLAYAVHYYTAEPGTQHQGDLRGWANVALNKGFALFVSEFGISEANGKGSIDTKEADVWFEFLDKNSIGWANWTIAAGSDASWALNAGASATGGWQSSNLSASGTYIKGKLVDYGTKTWTVNVTKEGQGSFKADPPGPTYQHGTMVTLTATGEPGWTFERWGGTDGSNLGTKNPATFSSPLYSNKSVVAIFGQGSMIKNGTFTNNTENWQGSGMTIALDAGTLKATVTEATASVMQPNVNLESSTEYTLSFRAKAASSGVTVIPRATNRASTIYWSGDPVALTTEWKEVTATFCMSAATDATGRIRFQSDDAAGKVWNLDDVMLNATGTCEGVEPPKPPQSVLPLTVKSQRSGWSISRVSGSLQLRGPAEAGARVSLYDVRGKVVRSMAASDGLTLGAGVPAGSYFVVVKSNKGSEVLRTKVVVAR